MTGRRRLGLGEGRVASTQDNKKAAEGKSAAVDQHLEEQIQ